MGEYISRRLVAASVLGYRLLLRLYPRDFHRAFGAEMKQVFQDCCRSAVAQSGIAGLVHLWLRTCADVVVTAGAEWLAQLRQAHHRQDLAYERSTSMRPLQQPHRVVLSLDGFTKRARNVFQLAGEEARALGHAQIGLEHVLLGLIGERNGVSGAVFHDLGITLEQTRRLVQSWGGARQSVSQPHPVSVQVVQVAEYAVEEAKVLNHTFVGTEHLLLALLRFEQGAGASSIEASGVSVAQIRARTLQILERRRL